MSVCLSDLGYFENKQGTVELWAPDYDKRRFWLCDDNDNRIDLSVEQAKHLRDILNLELSR